jgi:hypothetical protein
MSARNSAAIGSPVLLAVAIILLSSGETSPATPITNTTAAATVAEPSPQVRESPSPSIEVEGASASQTDRLTLALARFTEAGLELPNLKVIFSTDAAACKEHHGLFSTAFDPWRISICSPLDFVYEHELAHAWEHAMLNDQLRRQFMDLRGSTVWSGKDTPWNQRGQEDLAFVIQQGLSGLPLPRTLSGEAVSRVKAFELLTGRPAPRLTEWIEASETPCDERPTILSRSIPDAAGQVCSTASDSGVYARR